MKKKYGSIQEVDLDSIKSNVKEVIMSAMDEGIDNMDDFTAIVEANLEGVTGEELRGKVSKLIGQLTQLQTFGDSGKSFDELLKSGELDESIIDSALEVQLQKIEAEATIQDNVASTVYIEKSEPIAIDPKWERMCQEAQERGETLNGATLERLLNTYMQEEGLEQVETSKNPPSTLGEKAGEENELSGVKPPVVESPEVVQVASNVNPKASLNLQENGEEVNDGNKSIEKREYADKNGENKKVALITNNSNGEITNIQVFRSLISNVRMGQVEEVTNEITALANLEKTASKDEKQEDVLE